MSFIKQKAEAVGHEVETAVAPAIPSLTQVEKVVMCLSPILVGLAGWVATLIARYFPGSHINRDQVLYVFIAGISGGVILVWKFLDGHHKLAQIAAQLYNSPLKYLESGAADVLGPNTEKEIQGLVTELVDGHVVQIRQEIADLKDKLPSSVQETLANLLKNLGSPLAAPAAAAPTPAPVTAGAPGLPQSPQGPAAQA